IADGLARAGLGQTTCVGVGGDPNLSTTVLDLLPLFGADAERRAAGQAQGARRDDRQRPDAHCSGQCRRT
ncbi:MAG TPA: hypothetical protein VLH79_04920, partial [Chthonomonadales bacterium]|nr:hypothetical protein [Chthonomonadales bacterium]